MKHSEFSKAITKQLVFSLLYFFTKTICLSTDGNFVEKLYEMKFSFSD